MSNANDEEENHCQALIVPSNESGVEDLDDMCNDFYDDPYDDDNSDDELSDDGNDLFALYYTLLANINVRIKKSHIEFM